VAFQLQHAGFEIVLESDGRDVEARLAENPCDILILDLGLPDEDGLVLARKAREKRLDLGIIMLTARGSLEARIEGLEGGADIYLVKPVDMRELLAALHSLERRLGFGNNKNAAAEFWQLDRLTQTLTTPSGCTIEITAKESALLAHLAKEPGQGHR
jgi:DNA-binding response OmpR family regulator